MKRTIVPTIALAAAFTIALTSGAAVAQTPPPPRLFHPPAYLVLKAGAYSPSSTFDLNNFNGGNSTKFDSKTGFNGEIAFGYYLTPIVALELGGGYFESKGSPATPPGDTKLKVIPVQLSAKVLLPLGPVLEPYGEFGIGAYFSDFKVTGNVRDGFDGGTDTTFGLHAGAGVNLNITRYTFIGLEGRYIWAKPSYGGQDIKLDGFTVTANLGFRY